MFLADESVEREIVESLRADGHDVLYVAELEPGITDDDVFTRANATGRLLVTCDKDFGELTFRQGLVSAGVVLIRFGGLPARLKAEAAAGTIADHLQEMKGAFTVISPGLVRIRRASP